MNNLVSVIIPIYNAEQYLHESIKSVLDQTYTEIELILVNDGSVDKSIDICLEYSNIDKRVRIIDKLNEGVSKTRNRGLSDAKGVYIIFVDADDYIHKDLILYLTSEMSKTKVDLVVTGLSKVDSLGEVTAYRVMSSCTDLEKNREMMLKEIIGGRGGGSPCGKLFKADIIKGNNLNFPTTISNNEDVIFTLNYLLHVCQVLICRKWFYYYRVGHASNSNRYISDWAVQAEQIQQNKTSMVSNNEYSQYLLYSWCTLMVNGIIIETSPKNKKTQKEKMKSIEHFLSEIYDIPNFPKSINNLYDSPDPRAHFRYLFVSCSIFPKIVQKYIVCLLVLFRKFVNK